MSFQKKKKKKNLERMIDNAKGFNQKNKDNAKG